MTQVARSRASDEPTLSIGALSERTGVAARTIRAWEERHDFPRPQRLASGHRRYAESDVEALDEVGRLRAEGMRLDKAIERVLREGYGWALTPQTPSVYAELRRLHPELVSHRLHKGTLIGLSHAIEDEFCARARGARLFASFQHVKFWRPARVRWRELTRVAGPAFIFADLAEAGPDDEVTGVTSVDPGDEAPLRREWVIVCDSSDLPVVLTAWESPGQDDVPDRRRLFDAVWTVDRHAVRTAARVCAALAAEHGAVGADDAVRELAGDPSGRLVDLATYGRLVERVVAYVDTPVAPTVPLRP